MADVDRATQPGPTAANPLAQDAELVADFILESQEHLRSIEASLLAVEGGAPGSDSVHAMFRGFHTIKGLAGFLEFDAIRTVSHETETLLDRARQGELELTAEVVDVVLESADFLGRWLDALQRSESGPEPGTLIDRVRRACDANRGVQAAPAAVEQDPVLTQLSALSEVAAEHRPPSAPQQVTEARAVKVDTRKLDHLVDMVGEMVIAQSMIQHDPELRSMDRPRLLGNLTQLGRITNEVQKTAMAMRMMPVENLFQRMRRVIRDLARKTGKEVDLELSGGETELDRNLVEELADPLMHMVRNAMDHGIESLDDRLAAGKPACGKIRLKASHRSGHIVIEVSDDGRGLDRRKIIDKAIRNGLIASGDDLSDDKVYDLIFEPGFSTAAAVTDVSGRGVGMDVVRRHVQKLRGRVEIQTEPGRGSTFFLKLPLTLAILEGLIVGVGMERYILPLFAVREMMRPAKGQVYTVQDKGEMAMVRGRLLPLVRLYRRFDIAPKTEEPAQALLIVAEAANRVFCLMVDELIGKQEVVIKNLGSLLRDTPGIAGGAILGDGRVGLIVDLDRIYEPRGGVQNPHAA